MIMWSYFFKLNEFLCRINEIKGKHCFMKGYPCGKVTSKLSGGWFIEGWFIEGWFIEGWFIEWTCMPLKDSFW